MAQLSGQPAVLESRVIRKATVRLVPFLGLLYLINYLDRVNIGFAALTMNSDLGLILLRSQLRSQEPSDLKAGQER